MRTASQGHRRKPLSDLEAKVMRFVWSYGPSTSEQVRSGLEGEHPMKEATARTLLRRLEKKGYVTHHVDGRTYIYRGVERPENVAVSALRQVLDRFCSGSLEKLLVGMVDQEVITSKELNELARKIDQRQKKA